MTSSAFGTGSVWSPLTSVLDTADSFLARTATENAVQALHCESQRRLGWRYEESEYLLLGEQDVSLPLPG